MTGTRPLEAKSHRPPIAVPDASIVSDLHAAEGERLFNFARYLGLSDEEAADIVQESLLRLWRQLRQGTELSNPAGWTNPSVSDPQEHPAKPPRRPAITALSD